MNVPAFLAVSLARRPSAPLKKLVRYRVGSGGHRRRPPPCHPERSEGSRLLERIGQNHAEILRCAQDDNHRFLAVSLANRPSSTRGDMVAYDGARWRWIAVLAQRTPWSFRTNVRNLHWTSTRSIATVYHRASCVAWSSFDAPRIAAYDRGMRDADAPDYGYSP
jgi:hypothetical protein